MLTARWWHREQERIRCELCPRECLLKEGQAGYCAVRFVRGGGLLSAVRGRHGGLCSDPIEKKPLYHVHPGSRILSFGTAGCNLGCDFCQNWRISRGSPWDLGLRPITAGGVVKAARDSGCSAVAFTYNEPVISAEWCIEVADAAREQGLLAVAVSGAYIAEAAWKDFFGAMDAVNLDLKAFSDAFYRHRCKGRLAPVLAAIKAAKAAGCWVELTNLLIPGENDSEPEVTALGRWVAENLGPDTPLHFTAFHPDYRLADRSPTPLETLREAREIALREGLHHVYTGNLRDPAGSSTFCASCGSELIRRDGFRVLRNALSGKSCPRCGHRLAGLFEALSPAAALRP